MPRQVVIEVPEDIEERLKGLPSPHHPNRFEWTEEADEFLRKHWGGRTMLQTDIARMLGVCANTARARYREIQREGKG